MSYCTYFNVHEINSLIYLVLFSLHNYEHEFAKGLVAWYGEKVRFDRVTSYGKISQLNTFESRQ